jgi:hypothetical protein
MKKHSFLLAVLVAFALFLSGCSGGADVKEKLGLESTPPDEFSVVARAPLSVPPDFALRPPRPGAERPNELTVREQAKRTVFGGTADTERVSDQNPFLKKLGTGSADQNIRASIDTEIKDLEEKEQPVAEKLLFWKDKAPVGKPLDPVEEKKRLEAEAAAQKATVSKRNEDILKTP